MLLVHGYNNDEAEARQSYERFVERLRRIGAGATAVLGDLGKFYWPGDADLGPVSFISYPTEIRPARDSAARLAPYLGGLTGPEGTPTEIFFVCHSLGSRLTLELLNAMALQPSSPVRFAGTCLMAAAVPVEMVEDAGQLLPGATLSGTTVILYSRDDIVLQWAFPLGQTVAGEGFFPTAVGRFGQPWGLWSGRSELSGDNHGDYWKDPRAAARVARLLGVAVPVEIGEASIASRALPDPPLASTRAISDRPLATRSVVGA